MHNATILIRNQTRERLKEIGRKNQTYDQVIIELIEWKLKKTKDYTIASNDSITEAIDHPTG
jgi:predicted CopG family antitoxin